MPGFDGTGPRGQGAMTGGGRGYCAVNLSGAVVRPMAGRGFYGRGGGRGFRNCFYATGMPGWMRGFRGMRAFGGSVRALPEEGELAMLKDQAEYLKSELDAIQARIQDLAGKEEAK